MKPLNIYIDHVVLGDAAKFAKILQEKLKSIKQEFSIETFADLSSDRHNWENNIKKAIDKADIIIPIISTTYLTNLTESIQDKFNSIIESENKYLFPILYSSSNWSSFDWIVKSKIVPESNKPLTEFSTDDVDIIINDFIQTINAIIIKHSKLTINNTNFAERIKIEDQVTIFISHDHDDADFAELLKLQLEKHDIIGWIDRERLKIGQDWRQEIDEGIIASSAVIAIMTPKARKSEYVTYEWAFAWGKGKKIFPLMLKQTQIHPRLESLQYLDFTIRDSRPYGKLISSLKELIR